jgi:hypothetical protein
MPALSRYRQQRNLSVFFNGIFLLLIMLQSIYISHQAIREVSSTRTKLDFVQSRQSQCRRFQPVAVGKASKTDEYTDSSSQPPSTPSQIFPVWNKPFPCISWEGRMKRTETKEGPLYLKEIKTGSSTLAGVTIQIARNVAQRLPPNNYIMCRARFQHLQARKFEFRNHDQSFLWTVLRDPTPRLVSKFFHFGVSRQGLAPTALEDYYRTYDNWIMDHAHYLKTMTLRDINPREIGMYENYTQTIMNDFDFVGTTG